MILSKTRHSRKNSQENHGSQFGKRRISKGEVNQALMRVRRDSLQGKGAEETNAQDIIMTNYDIGGSQEELPQTFVVMPHHHHSSMRQSEERADRQLHMRRVSSLGSPNKSKG